MNQDLTKYTESFNIRASEVDEQGKATLPALCALFQEVAGNHALTLNFDITDLHKQNLTWVLHRMDIKINRYPDWREPIRIETWPAAGDALRAYRDYRVLDQNENELGCCLSYWMMINLKTRRPVRMPQEILELRLNNIDHVMDIKTDRLKPFQEMETEKKFTVRNSDLDMNNHVNNTRYLEWMMETLPPLQRNGIRQVDIMFMQESYYEDRIHSQMRKEAKNKSLHQLKNKNDHVVALANMEFS